LPLPEPEEKMPALAVWTPEDGLLGALAPLGLALGSPDPVLVVDLDPGGPRYPGETSLARLVAEEPRREHLRAGRSGVAVLRNGGVAPGEAAPVVEALLEGWDRVVLRLPPRRRVVLPVPIVPVRMLLPGGLFDRHDGPSVYQATPAPVRLPGPGIRLPAPARATVGALVRGGAPPRWDRWVRAWRPVWEAPWRR
jgi:hypothetical protein